MDQPGIDLLSAHSRGPISLFAEHRLPMKALWGFSLAVTNLNHMALELCYIAILFALHFGGPKTAATLQIIPEYIARHLHEIQVMSSGVNWCLCDRFSRTSPAGDNVLQRPYVRPGPPPHHVSCLVASSASACAFGAVRTAWPPEWAARRPPPPPPRPPALCAGARGMPPGLLNSPEMQRSEMGFGAVIQVPLDLGLEEKDSEMAFSPGSQAFDPFSSYDHTVRPAPMPPPAPAVRR